MKIKTIIKISIALLFLQLLPLLISYFSPEFKLALITESFGKTPSQDAVKIFDLFSLVVGLMGIAICFLMYGVLKFTDLVILRRLSFLFFVLMGFFALPDLIGAIKGDPTAPLPVIVLNLAMIVLLLYGSKKGTV
jgi:predicted membrane channel-forming protein YqfA (hemolysin III family)